MRLFSTLTSSINRDVFYWFRFLLSLSLSLSHTHTHTQTSCELARCFCGRSRPSVERRADENSGRLLLKKKRHETANRITGRAESRGPAQESADFKGARASNDRLSFKRSFLRPVLIFSTCVCCVCVCLCVCVTSSTCDYDGANRSRRR